MSPPRCGLTTVVVPLSTWSPVNSARSSSRKKHRWFGAWPGVCSASSRNSVPSIVSPSASTRSSFERRPRRPSGTCRTRRSRAPVFLRICSRRGPVIGMRVREQHPAHAVAHRRADDRRRRAWRRRDRDRSPRPRRCRRDRCWCPARSSGPDCSRRRAGRAATARSAPRGSSAGHSATSPSPCAPRRGRPSVRDVGERDRPRVVRCAASSPGSATRSPVPSATTTGVPSASRGTRVERRRSSVARVGEARERAARLISVGKIRSMSPRACCASASAGRTHADATSSLSSCAPSSPSGARRHEEPRVVAAGRAERREPVREHAQLAGVEHEIAGLEHLAERERAGVERVAPPRGAASCSDRPPVPASRASRIPASSKHSRTAATRNASPPPASPCSALAAASSRPTIRSASAGVAVGGVDRAAREHGRAGTEHRPARALQHEDVQVGTIGDEDDRRRVADRGCRRRSSSAPTARHPFVDRRTAAHPYKSTCRMPRPDPPREPREQRLQRRRRGGGVAVRPR